MTEEPNIIHMIAEAQDNVTRYIHNLNAQLRSHEQMGHALQAKIADQAKQIAAKESAIASLNTTIAELQQAMEKLNVQGVGV